MDICFQALQGETTGLMIKDATEPIASDLARTDDQRRWVGAARTSSARTGPAAAPRVFGDISGLTTWFCMALRSETRGTEEVHDTAA